LLIIGDAQILTRRLNGINEFGINIVSNICSLQLIILLQQKKKEKKKVVDLFSVVSSLDMQLCL